jgi:hypothetical protein
MARRKVVVPGKPTRRNYTMCALGIGGPHHAFKDDLIPSRCKVAHGSNGHRICRTCWFHPTKGFAREGVNHGCPGCAKRQALPMWVKPKKTASSSSTVISLD